MRYRPRPNEPPNLAHWPPVARLRGCRVPPLRRHDPCRRDRFFGEAKQNANARDVVSSVTTDSPPARDRAARARFATVARTAPRAGRSHRAEAKATGRRSRCARTARGRRGPPLRSTRTCALLAGQRMWTSRSRAACTAAGVRRWSRCRDVLGPRPALLAVSGPSSTAEDARRDWLEARPGRRESVEHAPEQP